MKTLHLLTSLLLIVTLTDITSLSKASVFNPESTNFNTRAKENTLTAGTPVIVETLETYNAKNLSSGQVISVRVKFNVVNNKQVLISAGALGTAIVSEVVKPKGFGKPGKLIINLQSVQSVDGQQILLSGNSSAMEGENRKGLAWGVGLGAGVLTSGVGLLAGFAFKGKDAELKAGTTFNSYVASDTEIDIANDSVTGSNN